MKKYYLIQEWSDFGFWDESKQEFRGILYATKYEFDPSLAELDQLQFAVNKKPCMVVSTYYPE